MWFALFIIGAVLCVAIIVTLIVRYYQGITRAGFIAGLAVLVALLVFTGFAIFKSRGTTSAPATASTTTAEPSPSATPESAIPNVDQIVDLDQTVIDERFGHYSRYVLRSSWPSLANIRARYSGFDDAVSLPLAVDQAWFDAANHWSPSQTVTNPDGTTSTITDEAAINAALQAREDYLDGLSDTDRLRYYREQIYNEILRNPIYGDMVARFFLEDELIAAHNREWIQEFVDQTDAAYAAPDDQPQGIEYWLQYDPAHTGDDRNQYLMTTDAYYQYAARLCLVLEYFSDEGVSSPTADEHYCLPSDAEITQLRTEKADYREAEAAYLLVYKTKDGQVADRFGFNLLDRRVERPEVAQPTPAPTPAPTKTPAPTPTPTPTPPPPSPPPPPLPPAPANHRAPTPPPLALRRPTPPRPRVVSPLRLLLRRVSRPPRPLRPRPLNPRLFLRLSPLRLRKIPLRIRYIKATPISVVAITNPPTALAIIRTSRPSRTKIRTTPLITTPATAATTALRMRPSPTRKVATL